MTHKHINELWQIMIALLVATVTLAMISTLAYAQPRCHEIILPDGTLLHCDIQSGTKVYVDDAGNVYGLTSAGSGDFEVIGIDDSGICTATLKPTNISINSMDPSLGVITTTLDSCRTPTESQIRSIAPGNSLSIQTQSRSYSHG